MLDEYLMNLKTLADIDVSNKRVLVREDLNVPLQDGKITDDTRIQRALETIQELLRREAAVILLSHLGRPKEGEYDEQFSLAPVAQALSDALGLPVALEKDWLGGVDVQPGQVVLCENVRFNQGEKNNDPNLAKQMAALCDVFVMDAFAVSHRAQASTVGLESFAKQVCAGPLLIKELTELQKALGNPERPLAAIVGGSKVSTKLHVLTNLIEKVDILIVGGGIANTFIKAQGHDVGQSLYESDFVSEASQLLVKAKERGVVLPLPTDVITAKEFNIDAQPNQKSVEAVADDELILDIGLETASHYAQVLSTAKTIVWNGPVGVFEFPAFSEGTRKIAKSIADSDAYSIAGGGDTIAALAQFNLKDRVSYICTGGGAFLEFLQGSPLPAVAKLEERTMQHAES